MWRGILIVFLAAGAVLGFAAGFGRLCGYHGYGWHHGFGPGGHMAFEDRAAEACVRAAERVMHEQRGEPPRPSPAAIEPKAPAAPAP